MEIYLNYYIVINQINIMEDIIFLLATLQQNFVQFLVSSIRATCTAHSHLFDFSVLITVQDLGKPHIAKTHLYTIGNVTWSS
jgi:hypothetical protein